MIKGGIADKLGNGYEAQWALLQALKVIRGEHATRLKIEPIIGGKGFEFFVTVPDGDVWHQTKRGGPNGSWTLKAIESSGFLQAVARKAKADPSATFYFVSTEPVADLLRLTDKARLSESFDDFKATLNEEQPAQFQSLANAFVLDEDHAYRLLRRVRVAIVAEDTLKDQVKSDCGFLFLGNVEQVVARLKTHLEEELTHTLTTETLRASMRDAGFPLRIAAVEPSAYERLEEQNKTYLSSYPKPGIDGDEIERPEAAAIINALRDANTKVVAVTGVAGAGKSAIVRQAAQELKAQGVVQLLTRIDQLLDVRTTQMLGDQVFVRAESPCFTLSNMAKADLAVIFVDQLDAISEISGRPAPAKDLLVALLSEVDRLDNVKIVVGCRSYDFDNDHRFQAMKQGERFRRIEVGLLDFDSEVAPYLDRVGVAHEQISPGQRDLVRLPLNLNLLIRLAKSGVALGSAASTFDLLTALIEHKSRQLRSAECAWSLEDVLSRLADTMSQRERLDAPRLTLNADQFDYLVSAHLITPDEQRERVRFFHESLFDYAFARGFVQGTASLRDWLTSSEQVLFRRTQVRQILDLLRSADRSRYLREVRSLLTADDVRAHIKVMISRWLASLPAPSIDELNIILSLDTVGGIGELPVLVRRALPGDAWPSLLAQHGVFEKWLDTDDNARRNAALWLLVVASNLGPQVAADALRAWWGRQPHRCAEIVNWLRIPRVKGSDAALAALYQELIPHFPSDQIPKDRLPHAADVGHWIHRESASAANLYRSWLARWFEVHAVGHPFKENYDQHDSYWHNELATKQPAAFLEAIAPYLAMAFERETAEGKTPERYNSSFEFRKRERDDSHRSTMDLVRMALRQTARDDPERARRVLAHLNANTHLSALHLHLEAIAANAELYDAFVPLIEHPGLFRASWDGARWDSAARAIAAALPRLSSVPSTELWARLRDYRPELDQAGRALRMPGDSHSPVEWRQLALSWLSASGESLRGILTTIGANNLPVEFQSRLRSLDRKFADKAIPRASRSRGGFVASPIKPERAKFMNDAAWLVAMKKYAEPRRREWNEDGPVGGGEQLAQVLTVQAKEEPERFLALFERLPADALPNFHWGIIEGLAQSECSESVARRAALLCIGREFLGERNPFSRFVERRPLAIREPRVFEELKRLALSGPYEDRTKESIEDDDHRKLESVLSVADRVSFAGGLTERGNAIDAVAEGLAKVPELLDHACELVEALINGELPRPLRCRLVGLVHAIAVIDLDRGFRLLEVLTRDDAYPLATGNGINLVVVALFRGHELGPLLSKRVLEASDSEIRAYAPWILAQYAMYGHEEPPELAVLWEDSAIARLLAARVAINASQNVEHPLPPRAAVWLERFFYDPDELVRKEAATFGRSLSGPDHATRGTLAEKLAVSPAFLTDPDDLLYGLQDRGAEFPRAVVAAAKAYYAALKGDPTFAERMSHGTADHWLTRTVLAAYRFLEGENTFRKDALDIIDMMAMHDHLGSNPDELNEHER